MGFDLEKAQTSEHCFNYNSDTKVKQVCTCVQLCQKAPGVKLFFCRGLHDSMSTSLYSSEAGCNEYISVELSTAECKTVQLRGGRKVQFSGVQYS